MSLLPEQIIDIAAALREHSNDGPLQSVTSDQLNINLLRLHPGAGIAAHVIDRIDVVFMIFAGQGELMIDGVIYALGPGQVFVVPQGTLRALRCTTEPLVYVTCHRRRAGLMPS